MLLALPVRYASDMSKHRTEEARQYKQELIRTLLGETLKIIQAQGKEYGPEFVSDLTQDYLASFITTLIYTQVNAPTGVEEDPELDYEVGAARFIETKHMIEEAIASSFEKAFSLISPGAHPEYQCEIICLDAGLDTGQRT